MQYKHTVEIEHSQNDGIENTFHNFANYFVWTLFQYKQI